MKWIKTIFSSDYGMLGVLVILCLFFSWITLEEQQPEGVDAAEVLALSVDQAFELPGRVLIAGRKTDSGEAFTNRLDELLRQRGWEVTGIVQGGPPELGKGLRSSFDLNESLDLLACEKTFVKLAVLQNFQKAEVKMAEVLVMAPESSFWPNFLKASNLLNVANQIAVIAILAIGMTLIVITAGIDLSVGSLIAVSAVLATWVIREWFGGDECDCGWNDCRLQFCNFDLLCFGTVFGLDGRLFWGAPLCGDTWDDDGGKWSGLHAFGRTFDLSITPIF